MFLRTLAVFGLCLMLAACMDAPPPVPLGARREEAAASLPTLEARPGESLILHFPATAPARVPADEELVRAARVQPGVRRAIVSPADPALRERYGVTVDGTFVLVDGSGALVKRVTEPSLFELVEMLR